MPRTKLDRYAEPRRDPMKGILQERIAAKDFTPEMTAGVMGVSKRTVLNRFKDQHTEFWPLGEIRRLNTALRTEIEPEEVDMCLRLLGLKVRK